MSEIWKRCEFVTGNVWASSIGNIRCGERLTTGIRRGKPATQLRPAKNLSPWINKQGYLTVSIQVEGKRKKYLVHRLVATAFHGSSELTVNHIDGNKLNNDQSNLEWLSNADNTRHQWRIGLVDIRGENHPSHKLSNAQAKEVRESTGRVVDIADFFGISTSLVYMIRQGRKRVA